MTTISTQRGLTAFNDFQASETGANPRPIGDETRFSLFVSFEELGAVELRLIGSNLQARGGLNPDGRVTAIEYRQATNVFYRIDDFSISVDALVNGLTREIGYKFLLNGDDQITGSGFDDLINGFGGDDEINAGFGADEVFGGDGDDRIFGFGGDDLLFGASGGDVIRGGAGRDRLFGDGPDLLSSSNVPGDDTIYGDGGRDVIHGGGGDDFLSGGGARDRLFGEDGADRLVGLRGRDSLDGGAGNDSLDGGFVHDTLIGGAGDDTLLGRKGGDELFGGDGDDVLEGGRGLDRLSGGDGEDRFVFKTGDGNDRVLDFKSGADIVDLGLVREITGFADLADNHLRQNGDDALITFNKGSVRLFDVEAETLSESDFIF